MIIQNKEVKAPAFLIEFGSKKQPFGDQVETALQDLWKELAPKPETEIKSKEDDTPEAPDMAYDGLAKSIALCFLQWPQKVPLHAGLMAAYIASCLSETEVVNNQTRISLLKKIFDHITIEVTTDLKNGKLNRALCFFRFAACFKTIPVLSLWVKPLETLYLKSLADDSVGILNKDIICYLLINYLLDSLRCLEDLIQNNTHLVDAIKKHMVDRKNIEIQNPSSLLTELSEHRKKCYSPFKTSNLELFIDPLQAVFQSLMDITQVQGIEDSQFSSQYIVRSFFNKSFTAKYTWNSLEENSEEILNMLPDLHHSVNVNFSLAAYNQNMHPILEFYFTECRIAYPKLLGYSLDKDVKEVPMPRFQFMQLRQLLRSIVQEYEADIERCYQVLLQVTCLHRHYLIVLLEFLMAEMLISKRPLFYHRLMQYCSREQESLRAMIPTIVYIYLRKIPDLNLFGLERMADFVSYWYAVEDKNFDIKWWTSRFEQGSEKPIEHVVKAEIDDDDDMETITADINVGNLNLSLVKTNDEEVDVVFEETSLLDLYSSDVENLLIRIFKKYTRLRHIQDLKKLLPPSFLRFVKEDKEYEFFDESETPFEFKALINFLCYEVERKKEDNLQNYSRQEDEFYQQTFWSTKRLV
eukprot:GHVP01069651.1.p1 GENE.GHVP01069651.1~~GHVP01069651.1.p1  ORF type:complete len:638 (-),score=121.20 GHVP01069651.1:1760-3673(-)